MQQSFQTAKAMLGVLQVIGWAIVGLAAISILIGADEFGFAVALVSGVALGAIGIGIVVGVQLAGAQIATAENTAEMVDLLKRAGQRADVVPSGARAAPMSGGAAVAGDAGPDQRRVKVYKGYEILKSADGLITVDGEPQKGLLAAERYINGLISKGS